MSVEILRNDFIDGLSMKFMKQNNSMQPVWKNRNSNK